MTGHVETILNRNMISIITQRSAKLTNAISQYRVLETSRSNMMPITVFF